MKRIWFYYIIFLFLLSCASKKDTNDDGSISTVLPDEITEVGAMRLELSDFHHELIANGTVSSRSKADLRFQLSENIAAIYVKNGDRIAKGQPIAMLDRFKLQNTLAQAKDNLERARLDLQDVLIGQGYSLADSARIPPDVMQLAQLRSNYGQSLNQYTLAEYYLQNAVLYAPFDGVVANLFAKVYNLPDGSQPFCTVLDNTRLEVEFKVLENDLPFLNKGDKVLVSPYSINDFSCEGQVAEINPMIDQNGMVKVKAFLSNTKNQLFDGMNVKIRVQRSLGKRLLIPKEALVLRTNRKVVFTLKDEKDAQTLKHNECEFVMSTYNVTT
jgi:RND family efflux transporter MFP subunit